MAQDNPNALALAVLCDFGDRDLGTVVTCIVRHLRELLGANERGFREYMMMLELLLENRDLRTQVEETEHMLTEIDIDVCCLLPSATNVAKRKGRGLVGKGAE